MAQPAEGMELARPLRVGRFGVEDREAFDVDAVAEEHPAAGVDVEGDGRVGGAQVDGGDEKPLGQGAGVSPAIEDAGMKAVRDRADEGADGKTHLLTLTGRRSDRHRRHSPPRVGRRPARIAAVGLWRFSGLSGKRSTSVQPLRKRVMKKPSMPAADAAAPWQGNVRTAAGRREQVLQSGDLFGCNGHRHERVVRHGCRHLVLAFLGFERTGAIDQGAAGLKHGGGAVDHAGLDRPASAAMSAGCFSQATSGWRRMVPVEEQGASSRTASKGCGGDHVEDVGGDGFGGEVQPGEVGGEALQPVGRDVDGGDAWRRHWQARRSCRRARRRGRRRACRRRRRAGARAGSRRRPAPTIRPRHSRAAPPPDRHRRRAPTRWRASTPPSFPAQPGGSLLTEMSSAGSTRWAAAMARVVSSP